MYTLILYFYQKCYKFSPMCTFNSTRFVQLVESCGMQNYDVIHIKLGNSPRYTYSYMLKFLTSLLFDITIKAAAYVTIEMKNYCNKHVPLKILSKCRIGKF